MANIVNSSILVRNLGRLSYARCLDVQKTLRERAHEGNNTLLLVEHSSPIYTVGNNECKEGTNLLKKRMDQMGIDVQRVANRGQGIVWHGPGQLTLYPFISNYSNQDLIQSISSVISKTMSSIGLQCTIQNDGIYVGDQLNEKIGDIEFFSNEMQNPGFSININPNLSYYKMIEKNDNNENNIEIKTKNSNLKMSSVWNELNNSVSIGEIVPILLDAFEHEFGNNVLDSNKLYQMKFKDLQPSPIFNQTSPKLSVNDMLINDYQLNPKRHSTLSY